MSYAHYIAGIPFCPLCFPFAPSCLSSGRKASGTGQNGANVKLYLSAFVFSRDFARPKTAKIKIYFTFGAFVVLLSSSFGVAVVVSTGCRWCRVQGFRCSLSVCSVALSCLLSLCCSCFPAIPVKYASISLFKGVLRGFAVRMYICMG